LVQSATVPFFVVSLASVTNSNSAAVVAPGGPAPGKSKLMVSGYAPEDPLPVTDGWRIVAASPVFTDLAEPRTDGSHLMVRTGDKGTQFGAPARGKDASSRSARGRVCVEPGCDSVLSTYNAAPTCWMDEAPALRHPLYGTKARG